MVIYTLNHRENRLSCFSPASSICSGLKNSLLWHGRPDFVRVLPFVLYAATRPINRINLQGDRKDKARRQGHTLYRVFQRRGELHSAGRKRRNDRRVHQKTVLCRRGNTLG